MKPLALALILAVQPGLVQANIWYRLVIFTPVGEFSDPGAHCGNPSNSVCCNQGLLWQIGCLAPMVFDPNFPSNYNPYDQAELIVSYADHTVKFEHCSADNSNAFDTIYTCQEPDEITFAGFDP